MHLGMYSVVISLQRAWTYVSVFSYVYTLINLCVYIYMLRAYGNQAYVCSQILRLNIAGINTVKSFYRKLRQKLRF